MTSIDINQLIDKQAIKTKIEELKSEIAKLEDCLNGSYDYVYFQVIYHNRATFYGCYDPDDDYDISYIFKYSDNWRNKLVAIDEALSIVSNGGYFQEVSIKVGKVAITTIEEKEKYSKILETENREEIIKLIRELHKISKEIPSIKSKINSYEQSLKFQEILKEEYQNKEKIKKVKEELDILNNEINTLTKRDTEIKHELKHKFGIDYDEIMENIFEI